MAYSSPGSRIPLQQKGPDSEKIVYKAPDKRNSSKLNTRGPEGPDIAHHFRAPDKGSFSKTKIFISELNPMVLLLIRIVSSRRF